MHHEGKQRAGTKVCMHRTAELRVLHGDANRRLRQLIAERAKGAGVETVVFDRGGNKYHGRVAALAEGAREGGLDF